MDWVYDMAEEMEIDMRMLGGEAFQDVTGEQLCTMTLHDFLNMDARYGGNLYQKFRDIYASEGQSSAGGWAGARPK